MRILCIFIVTDLINHLCKPAVAFMQCTLLLQTHATIIPKSAFNEHSKQGINA